MRPARQDIGLQTWGSGLADRRRVEEFLGLKPYVEVLDPSDPTIATQLKPERERQKIAVSHLRMTRIEASTSDIGEPHLARIYGDNACPWLERFFATGVSCLLAMTGPAMAANRTVPSTIGMQRLG